MLQHRIELGLDGAIRWDVSTQTRARARTDTHNGISQLTDPKFVLRIVQLLTPNCASLSDRYQGCIGSQFHRLQVFHKKL